MNVNINANANADANADGNAGVTARARALLNALRGEEEKVNLMETQQSSQDVLRDW